MTRHTALLAAISLCLAHTPNARGSEAVSLAPDPAAAHEALRVDARLRLTGAVAAESADNDPVRRPVSLDLRLGYRQEGLEPSAAGAPRLVRVVDSATDASLVGRALVAEVTPRGGRVADLDRPLTRLQIDALQLPADPIDIDGLLPLEPKRDAGSWAVPPEAVARLLRLDSAAGAELTGVVDTITPRHVKIRLAGPINGVVEGARVSIDLRGVALFDRRRAQITRINLGWKEAREVGPATPAVEATAKLNLSITPVDPADRVAADKVMVAATTTPEWRLRLPVLAGRWGLLAERDWFAVASNANATVLRRVAGERIAAVTTLVHSDAPRTTSAEFERLVRGSLGDQLHEVITATELPSTDGATRRLVASVGVVENKPVEWRHFHVAAAGAAVSATVTLPSEEQTADDSPVLRLIDTLRPAPQQTAAAGPVLRVR